MIVCRWLIAAVLVLGALAGIGEAIPRWMMSPGMERYRTNPVAYAVAQAAYDTVWMLNDNPIGRAPYPRGSGPAGLVRARPLYRRGARQSAADGRVPRGGPDPHLVWDTGARGTRLVWGMGLWI